MPDALTALDETFLELEELDDGALMGIGGAMVFEPLPGGGVPTIDEVRATAAARLTELPRYTERLSHARTTSLARLHWAPDERFDVANHVRHVALPAPGSDAQLCDLTAEVFSHPLDRSRPLWEIVLVEGLEHGRWALVHKTHHCLVDGVGSVDVMQLLLDDAPAPAGRTVPKAPARAQPTASRGSPVHVPYAIGQAAHAGVHAAEMAASAALHPRNAFARSRALAELLVHDELAGAPRTSLNVATGQLRRFAVVRVPLLELRAIGREFEATVNDVALAVCATGLRALLRHRGEPLPRHGLRAMVPVNRRDGAGRLALGNQVSSLFVDLPVASPGPLSRLRQTAAATRRLKAAHAERGASALLDVAALAPPAVTQAALARTAFTRRLFNLTITNVPGPQRPLYAFGAPLQELHPVVPLAAEHAVGIAIFSYNGLVCFGINADGESTPDIDVLARGIEHGVEELCALLPTVPHHQQARY